MIRSKYNKNILDEDHESHALREELSYVHYFCGIVVKMNLYPELLDRPDLVFSVGEHDVLLFDAELSGNGEDLSHLVAELGVNVTVPASNYKYLVMLIDEKALAEVLDVGNMS